MKLIDITIKYHTQLIWIKVREVSLQSLLKLDFFHTCISAQKSELLEQTANIFQTMNKKYEHTIQGNILITGAENCIQFIANYKTVLIFQLWY